MVEISLHLVSESVLPTAAEQIVVLPKNYERKKWKKFPLTSQNWADEYVARTSQHRMPKEGRDR